MRTVSAAGQEVASPPPCTPTGERLVKRSEIIKCRITPPLKLAVDEAATRAGATTSDVLRRAIAQVVAGQSLDATVRADMLTVRLIANAVLSWAETSGCGDEEVRELLHAGERLRAVAARHLRPVS